MAHSITVGGRGYIDESRAEIIRSYVFKDIGIWHVFECDNIASFKSAHYRYLAANKLDYTFRFEHLGFTNWRVKRVS